MIWADREAKKIKERNLPLEWVDDMKTPSGRIHVGSLRGVLVHDLVYKALKQIGVKTEFSYVFNDMDQMDAVPFYLDEKKLQPYAGKPLYKIPSPEPGYKSFADYFAKEFISVFNSINCHPKIIWSSELYRSGKMNGIIKLFLDKAETVRQIYKTIAKSEKGDDWFPYTPICENCGNIGTTNVYKWGGKFVYYRCQVDKVEWAKGCGHEGKVEPINENGKLPWKLDWPAHWKLIGVTVESSGKDHMSSGGSYDMAVHFCKEILKIVPPDAMGGYEWFTVGGKKMSTSKGIGTSAKEVTGILPPEVFRFLLVRTPMTTHLDFNPYGDTIANLFDDYDRCLNAYFLKLENKIPEGKPGEVLLNFARIIELSEVQPLPKKRLLIPRFRTVANLLKVKQENIHGLFENRKGSPLNADEKAILDERITYAKIYLQKYAEVKSQKLQVVPEKKYKNIFPEFDNNEIFSIDTKIKEKVPSMIIGLAVIKGVKNQKNNTQVNKLLDHFIKTQSNLNTEDVNNYPEIQSYRKILKSMGIDYHSRRPAPEALLRRVASKKDLFRINACADIYNLVAMKYKVSGGVYDYEKIKFPVNLRFAKENETILLFGDKNATPYKPTEIAWFDQIGGFINFGYRDAQRTAVTEKTNDIFITIEGVFDINRETVEKALKMTMDEIIKYCGGKLEIAGVAEVGNNSSLTFKKISNSIFFIDKKLAEKYPSINIGIAVIKDVDIKKNDLSLSQVIKQFVDSQHGLNNEVISSYPEVRSYRQIYKEMGLDWHSKRPSPEALLRRLSQKKDLYQINTCVDAYNLIVMKNRVSIGAFDLDKMKFPTILRFPKDGEEILLLGDEKPTAYKTTDLAYFDEDGGYNIYFNYRDAQRTAVTLETKNIILNIDGIYDITRQQVEKSLKESIEIITKYCGGKVELAGIVSAS